MWPLIPFVSKNACTYGTPSLFEFLEKKLMNRYRCLELFYLARIDACFKIFMDDVVYLHAHLENRCRSITSRSCNHSQNMCFQLSKSWNFKLSLESTLASRNTTPSSQRQTIKHYVYNTYEVCIARQLACLIGHRGEEIAWCGIESPFCMSNQRAARSRLAAGLSECWSYHSKTKMQYLVISTSSFFSSPRLE